MVYPRVYQFDFIYINFFINQMKMALFAIHIKIL